MQYVDTRIIVKLYFREKYSRETANWLRKNDEAIPLTSFHELEFTNAINLKLFRKELTKAKSNKVFELFSEHQQRGVYYRPSINWSEMLTRAQSLSTNHTPGIGSRSLDIIHVALALSIGAERFFTFDDRQSQLAAAAGLQITPFL